MISLAANRLLSEDADILDLLRTPIYLVKYTWAV